MFKSNIYMCKMFNAYHRWFKAYNPPVVGIDWSDLYYCPVCHISYMLYSSDLSIYMPINRWLHVPLSAHYFLPLSPHTGAVKAQPEAAWHSSRVIKTSPQS